MKYFWGRQSCLWWAHFLDSQLAAGTHSQRHGALAILAALITVINQPTQTWLALGALAPTDRCGAENSTGTGTGTGTGRGYREPPGRQGDAWQETTLGA